MVDERLQFAITQYLEGTLPLEERAPLEATLAADPAARALVEEYRKLDALLKGAGALPAIHWDRLAEHLSGAVIQQQQELAERRRYSIRWAMATRRLAVAASFLLAAGAAVLLYRSHDQGQIPSHVAAPVALADVRVLVPEKSTGQAVLEVNVGPAPVAAGDQDIWHLNDGVVSRHSSVMIASEPQLAQDTERLLY